MNVIIGSYIGYLCICIAITIWVARSIRRNGRIMVTIDQQKENPLHDAFTHLLIVGYYLINIGMICLLLRYGEKPLNVESAIEILSTKIGGILIVLGMTVFVIIAKLAAVRKREQSLAAFTKPRDQHRDV